MKSTRWSLLSSCLVLSGVVAQQANSPFTSAPSEILAAGIRSNGLAGSKHPWHIRAHYEIFAYDGSPKESGTYEELWASAKLYRRTYASDKFNQTDFANGAALYRIGDQDWPDNRELQVRTLIWQPVPTDLELGNFDLEATMRSFGKAELPCVVLKSKVKSNVRVVVAGESIISPHYCFEANRSILRFASQGGGHDDTLFNSLIDFQGQYLAKEIRLTNYKEQLVVNVDVAESPSAINDSEFLQPTGAVGPLGEEGVVFVKSNALTYIKRPFVPYPEKAVRKRIQGKVSMQVMIGMDGVAKDIHVLDGPVELREAAVQAIQQARFRPFLILDEPVEVSTKLDFEFTGNFR